MGHKVGLKKNHVVSLFHKVYQQEFQSSCQKYEKQTSNNYFVV